MLINMIYLLTSFTILQFGYYLRLKQPWMWWNKSIEMLKCLGNKWIGSGDGFSKISAIDYLLNFDFTMTGPRIIIVVVCFKNAAKSEKINGK